MFKFISLVIFSIAIIKGSSYSSIIWEQFKEYQRSKNDHEIKKLIVSTEADIVKNILNHAQANRITDFKTNIAHVTIRRPAEDIN